jgi:hypothetical protein
MVKSEKKGKISLIIVDKPAARRHNKPQTGSEKTTSISSITRRTQGQPP